MPLVTSTAGTQPHLHTHIHVHLLTSTHTRTPMDQPTHSSIDGCKVIIMMRCSYQECYALSQSVFNVFLSEPVLPCTILKFSAVHQTDVYSNSKGAAKEDEQLIVHSKAFVSRPCLFFCLESSCEEDGRSVVSPTQSRITYGDLESEQSTVEGQFFY